MSNFIRNFERNNKKLFLKYKKYLQENDWSEPIEEWGEEGELSTSRYFFVKDIRDRNKDLIHEGKEPEFRIQNNITLNTLGRLKYFHKHVESDIGKNVTVDRLIKNMTSIIDIHTQRIERYLSKNLSIDKVDSEKLNIDKDAREIQSEDIDFENNLHKEHARITDEVRKLNLELEIEDSVIDILNDEKVPLSMRKPIEDMFPDIKKIVENKKIDFTTPPPNKMLIYMDKEEVPEWDPDKHYWEQDKKTLQFYVDEYKKMENGIRIGDVYINGWMYTHLNVYKAPIPTRVYNEIKREYETEDIIRHPPLRDNEWIIIQDEYESAKKEGKMMFLAATRRAAKTTNIASKLFYKAQTGGRELVVAGGSSKDLGQIQGNFDKACSSADPAFKLPFISIDWDKEVKMGMKRKNKRDIYLGSLFIVNLESGGSKSSEKLAGFTADAFILDECMKSPFYRHLEAAKPSFDSVYGKRCVAILSGTGNLNSSVTEDAHKILEDPNKYDVHQMDWKVLERNVPKEYITWKKRKFPTFLPAQMSSKVGMVKNEVSLSEYLGIEEKELEDIKILVTDWKKSLDVIKEDRENKDGDTLKSEQVYYPIDPVEIFLSGNTNPFPAEDIRRYKESLEETGDTGIPVVLEEDESGNVRYIVSEKEYPAIPFGGGFIDAPITIYQEPVSNIPFEFYIAGHDGYKQEEADSDSLGSFVVIRRDTGEVVASYHTRPDPTTKFYEQAYLLLKLYQSPVFMENEDMGFKEYLDRRKETDTYIVKGEDLLGDLGLNSNRRRSYGWQPTTKNKSYFLGIFINQIKSIEESYNEEGKFISTKGYQKIKDTRLLQEMINYSPGGNYDAIIAAMSAYAYDFYLTTVHGAPKRPETEEEKERKEEIIRKLKRRREGKRNIYSRPSRNLYSKARR